MPLISIVKATSATHGTRDDRGAVHSRKEKSAEQPVRLGPKKKREGKGGIPAVEMAKLMAFGSNTQIARPATKPSGSSEEVRRTIDAAEHMVAAQN